MRRYIIELVHYFLELRSALEDGDTSVVCKYYLCLYALPLLVCTSVGLLTGLLLELLNPITCCAFIGFFGGVFLICKFSDFLTDEEARLYSSTDDFEDTIDVIED